MWINLWLGKYHILSILDSLSPNPHVFLASQVKLNEYRVIKKIPKAHPFFTQLKKEAKFLSKYSSKLIPRLYDVEEDNENLYLVEEYVQGVSLSSEDFLKNKLKENELVSLADGLFDFLKFINSLEESVLYIDWKPGNIILTEKGLKAVDFGSVLYLEADETFTGLATEGFAAPELEKGGKPGIYTDIFGFGSIIKYLSELTEEKSSFFRCTSKEKLTRLATKCTRSNPLERPNLREIERVVKNLKGRNSFSTEVKEAYKLVSNLNAVKIGVCGSTNGVGTTHIALCVAKELAKRGRKVAYLSVTEDYGEDIKPCKSPEGLKNIQLYKNVPAEDITYFLRKNFDNLVMDFGSIEEFSILFHSCEEKLLVVQNNFIKGEELEEFLIARKGEIGEKGWTILDNLSDEAQLKATKALLRKHGLKAKCKGTGIMRI